MKNMKKLFRRNQIIITTLAIMIAAAGYLNYAGKQEVLSGNDVYEAGMMEISDEDILAENQALTADGAMEIVSPEEGMEEAEDTVNVAEATKTDGSQETEDTANTGMQVADGSQGEEAGMDNPGEAVLTSGMNVSEYIANVQLSREQVRAKNKETLNEIINNPSVDEASRQVAVNDMVEMTQVAEKENAAETLLQAKGFLNPVVSITDGQVDVVINAVSITDPQRAQIEDIVKRKTEVGAENIVITLLNTKN